MKKLEHTLDARKMAKAAQSQAVDDLKEKRLVCVEGTERFDFIDGSHCNMSAKRASAVIRDHIEATRREAWLSAGDSVDELEPMGNKWHKQVAAEIISHVMSRCVVSAAFDSVSGLAQGIVTLDTARVLIRKAVLPVEPNKGGWDNLRRFFESLFGVGEDPRGEEALHAVYCLLRAKLKQMRGPASARGSCPMLVLVGPPSTGKSLFASLCSQMLGQRGCIDPSGERNGWNDACLAHPVLFYDEASREEHEFNSGMSRPKFAEEFKRMEYGAAATIATRGQTARSLPAVWLWIRALNPDSRAAILQTPTPKENGMFDKLILCMCHPPIVPKSGLEGHEDREERWSILSAELPAFAHYLLHEFETKGMEKKWIRDATGREYRNQCPPFHHPEVLDLLEGSENDGAKLALTKAYLAEYPPQGEFTAGVLYSQASTAAAGNSYSTNEQAKALCQQVKSAEALGRLLSKLAEDPEGEGRATVTRKKRNNRSFYLYTPAAQPQPAG